MAVVYGPRHRSEGYETPAIAYWEAWCDNQKVATIPFSFIKRAHSIVMDDVVTEDFKMKSARGDIINNPMTKTVTEEYKQPSSGTIYHDDTRIQWSGELSFPIEFLEPTSVDLQDYESRAVTEAYARITSKEVQSLVSLGELRETKEMFISAVGKLHAVNRHLRNWDYLKRRKASWKDLRDAWMEVRFGWRPFYGEVKSYLALKDKLFEFPPRQTFRETRPVDGTVEDRHIVPDGNGIDYLYDRTTTISGRISAGVLCTQRYAGFPDTYGLWDIPGTAWELTKLSWFVDYFFDVGRTIASWTPDTLWSPVAAWVIHRTTVTQKWSHSGIWINNTRYTGVISGGFHTKVTVYYNRVPNPQRKFIPQFLPKMDWAKYVDAVALGTQVWEKTKSILGRRR